MTIFTVSINYNSPFLHESRSWELHFSDGREGVLEIDELINRLNRAKESIQRGESNVVAEIPNVTSAGMTSR